MTLYWLHSAITMSVRIGGFRRVTAQRLPCLTLTLTPTVEMLTKKDQDK